MKLNEAQIREMMPGKEERSLAIINTYEDNVNFGYNKAIEDCIQAVMKWEVGLNDNRVLELLCSEDWGAKQTKDLAIAICESAEITIKEGK